MAQQPYRFGSFVLDTDHGNLTRDGTPIGVSQRGLVLLQTLLRAQGQPLSKSQLLDAAWPKTAVEESNLSVQIAALRKVLGPKPGGGDWIVTVPRLGYRFSGAQSPAESVAKPHATAPSQPGEGPPRPSIAVLPFRNVSGDAEQEYLADGITEDIITALTRFRWFFVIGRNTSFAYKGKSVDSKHIAHELGVRYLLEGSLRKSGQRVRISAQLVDAATGNQIWAERYDLELTEVFAVQDEIAERVAGAAEPELLRTEAGLNAALHTGNMTSWDLVRRATWLFHQVRKDGHVKARDLIRQACKLDPALPEANIWLARVSAGLVAYAWSDNPEADIREGFQAGLTAVLLDEKNPYSHYAVAITGAYGDELGRSCAAAERAIEINPSFALGHLVLGVARLFSGQPAMAIGPLEHGLKLSPFDPQNFVWLNMLAIAQLATDQPEAALASASRALKVRSQWRPALETMACCYAATGRRDDAVRCVAELRKLESPPSDLLAPLRSRHPPWMSRLTATLRELGWEDTPAVRPAATIAPGP